MHNVPRSQCQCGDAHPMPVAIADDTKCSTNCSGDKAKICGSENSLSIYGTGITGEDRFNVTI